jgi:hypothetical protein
MKDSPCCFTSLYRKLYLVLSSVIVQMDHDQRDKFKDYWSTLLHFYRPLHKHNEVRQMVPCTEISTF